MTHWIPALTLSLAPPPPPASAHSYQAVSAGTLHFPSQEGWKADGKWLDIAPRMRLRRSLLTVGRRRFLASQGAVVDKREFVAASVVEVSQAVRGKVPSAHVIEVEAEGDARQSCGLVGTDDDFLYGPA